ncbi:MAG: RNA polymerase subunit sigma-70, partial [Planctomycetes bacterium]|nr:RNA polymerase subunit sigma-70 [Planctomycetota bacterium]
MATEKTDPEIRALIEEGKKKGFITYDEMNKVLPDDVVSGDKIDSILLMLDELGIEIVDEADTEEREGSGEEAHTAEEVPEEAGEPHEAEQPTEKIDDPVRMYLTQMGEIPL